MYTWYVCVCVYIYIGMVFGKEKERWVFGVFQESINEGGGGEHTRGIYSESE